MITRRIIAAVALCLLATSCLTSNQDNYHQISGGDKFTPPRFGDSYFRQNIAGTGVCDSPGPRGYLRLRFFKEVSETWEATPAVSGGQVFITGNIPGAESSSHLYAFDEYTGELKWRYETDKPDDPELRPPGFNNSPFITEKAVIIGDDCERIYCIDKSNGKLLWETEVQDGIAIKSTAVAHNGKIYIGGSDFYCLDEKTGKILWTCRVREGSVKASPAYYNSIVIFAEEVGVVRAHDAQTGKEIWRRGRFSSWTGKSSLGGSIFSSPSVADGVVCVGIGERMYAFNAKTGKTKWTYGPLAGIIGSSPAIWDKKVFFLTFEKQKTGHYQCYCLDLRNGKKLWSYDLQNYPGSSLSSPVVSEGIIYFGDGGGTRYALDAETGKVVFKEVFSKYASPSVAISDHAMFFTAEKGLYCLEDYRFNPHVINAACGYLQMKEDREKRKDKIAGLIEELGHNKDEIRKAALDSLRKLILLALPQIKANTKNSDQEIAISCSILLKEMKKDIEALEFIEKEGFGKSVEYFLLILESARDRFVEPSVKALERLTRQKFAGTSKEIAAVRKTALKQYKGWFVENNPYLRWNSDSECWQVVASAKQAGIALKVWELIPENSRSKWKELSDKEKQQLLNEAKERLREVIIPTKPPKEPGE